ncbi:MAG: Serine/threonine-protein kinase RsbT [Stenotrophomonas maltophilia]|uniref:Serine/threonine-protein kinase RsbT n=1 Tax=Stenotrophomonas maltophilia TaxID=40324 RepID=A0A7V8JN37_STEMA|nr:MAG: Serine/threonine-protein kinase RsbT [Stenotrophomonas maltophilia]
MNFSGHVTRVVVVEESTQVGQARREALALAEQIGFDETDAGRVALAASELASNLLRHGGGGRMYLSVVAGRGDRGVELYTIDAGPGFVLSQCLAEGYSTAGSQGLGLGTVRRQAALLDSWSDAHGSIVVARIYPERAVHTVDLAYGALRLAMRGESVCGDGWHLAVQGSQATLSVIDGLGHGLPASDAAQAGMQAAARSGVVEPSAGIAQLHADMAGTRGGAAAVASLAMDEPGLAFCGIGNINAGIADHEGFRGLASLPGIVGVQYRKAQPFNVHAASGTLLLMHSDGLQARWRLQDYPGLAHRHPALVVAVLQRDFDRGRDDACIVALRMGAL